LKPLAHRSVVTHTIDLRPGEAASDDEDPLIAGYRTAKASLAYDQVPTGSVLRVVYESDLVTRFIGSALEVDPIYRMADELGAMNIMYHDPGDELTWDPDSAAMRDERQRSDFQASVSDQDSPRLLASPFGGRGRPTRSRDPAPRRGQDPRSGPAAAGRRRRWRSPHLT